MPRNIGSELQMSSSPWANKAVPSQLTTGSWLIQHPPHKKKWRVHSALVLVYKSNWKLNYNVGFRGFICSWLSSSKYSKLQSFCFRPHKIRNQCLQYSGIHQRSMSTTSTAGLVIPCKGSNNIKILEIWLLIMFIYLFILGINTEWVWISRYLYVNWQRQLHGKQGSHW